MRVAVFGLGYVGLSIAVLLSRQNSVKAVDIDESRVAQVNSGVSPIADSEIQNFLMRERLDLKATTDANEALRGAHFAVIATPTDYDINSGFFDTSSVKTVLRQVANISPTTTVVIKSTIPVGFTQEVKKEFPELTILFSPEFLREGQALYDNLHPSRIVVAGEESEAKRFADLLLEGSSDPSTPVLLTGTTEAEAIKLFSNTYLAMRVAYFNEVDTFGRANQLNVRQIIEGVSLDPRIGGHYNNPSFGYGGYCLPKDTKQLLANYRNIPQSLIAATVASNQLRMDFIANDILSQEPQRVGVHRLIMKAGSDNFRASSIQGVMERLERAGVELLIFEPELGDSDFHGVPVAEDFERFAESVDVILANRWDELLAPFASKVYSRDIFKRD